MKKLLRWLIVTIVMCVIAAGAVYAYTALTAKVDTTLKEPLSWVGENSFTDNMYPKQTITHTVTIHNACADQSYDLDLTIEVTPINKGVTATCLNKVTVPANGDVAFDIAVTATQSVEPGVYHTEVTVDR